MNARTSSLLTRPIVTFAVLEDDLTKIKKAQTEIKNQLDQSAKFLGKIFQISCDLVTVFVNELCHFLERKKTAGQVDLEVIDLYLAAMQLVLSLQMIGDVGGAEGNKVLTGLAVVRERIMSGTS